MAIFQFTEDFYDYFYNNNFASGIINYIRLGLDTTVGDINNPPDFKCPGSSLPQILYSGIIDSGISGWPGSYDQLFYKSTEYCNCKGGNITNGAYFYLEIAGDTTSSVSIYYHNDLDANVLKITLLMGTDESKYVNIVETGYYDGAVFTPYFWHIFPLVCVALNTNVILKFNYNLVLPPPCTT